MLRLNLNKSLSSSLELNGDIQIQPMLRLNLKMAELKRKPINSNTTNVKVKHILTGWKR